ncbi:hypothetical protein AMJ71_07305 [candidate division TA06 bacterium SM1_40]|uniref:Glycosyltransferase RgtA/B/C/D-like domain-containing protein n=1 Tax=candidate division TA06 bacterium SM1_40 TaxID=1703773 RepID=A0A0S8JJU5_UNCT6|nr:MAG: hypothetical protein AMJ71_07305 [candidate division TA06 bacterium SM1_40]
MSPLAPAAVRSASKDSQSSGVPPPEGTKISPAAFRVLLVCICLLVSILFIQEMLTYTAGRWGAPLDDSYVSFQYARQLATGHPFQYNTGDPPSTGGTSLLYQLVLAAAYLVGFKGQGLVAFSYLFGVLTFVIATLYVFRLGVAFGGHRIGMAAGILFIANGAIAWGFFSGMEVGLYTLFVVGILATIAGSRGEIRWPVSFLACGLALTRPEGFFIVLLMVGALLWNHLFSRAPDVAAGPRRSTRALVWLAIPVAAGLATLALNLLLTGRLAPSSGQTKMIHQWVPPLESIRTSFQYLADVMKGIFAGSYPDNVAVGLLGEGVSTYFPPLTFLFFLLGIVFVLLHELTSKRAGWAVISALWLVGGIGLVAFTTARGFQRHRYILPYFPIILAFVPIGISWVARVLGERSGLRDYHIFWAVMSFFIFFSVCSIAPAISAHVAESGTSLIQYEAMAHWIDGNLPLGRAVAVVDVGILKYYGNRPIVDIVGLVSRPFMGAMTTGWGTVWEVFEHMPMKDRPAYLAIQDVAKVNFPGIDDLLRIWSTQVCVAGEPFHTHLALYRADWLNIGSGTMPLDPYISGEVEGLDLTDELDAAYLPSEAGHSYENYVTAPGTKFWTSLALLASPSHGDVPVADGGRYVWGAERFTMRTVPGRDLVLVTRVAARANLLTLVYGTLILRGLGSAEEEPIQVFVAGEKVGEWLPPRQAETWEERMVRIPGSMIDGEETTIELSGRFHSFHHWSFQ